MVKSALRLLFVVAFMVTTASANADDDDQDRAQQALARGEIRPLNEVLDVARRLMPGEVVKVELEHKHGGWVYKFKILDPGGKRREIKIDASSLHALKID